MAYTDLLVPSWLPMLRAMSAWLDKTKGRFPAAEAEALMAARIAPDMHPLSTQIRYSCVQVLEALYRLQGQDFPDAVAALRDEGTNAGDTPGSIADAQKVIADTIARVEALGPGALDMAPDAPIAHGLPNGMILDLTARQYVRDWAIPQFYFHVMAGYMILRHKGLDIGKGDYCGHILQHLRPGTMPEA